MDKPRFINLGGREYPCRLTMGAALRYKRATGKDINTITDDDTLGQITFLWCCVAAACNADGVEFALNLDDFADRLEPSDLVKFFQGLQAAQEEEKKTLTE